MMKGSTCSLKRVIDELKVQAGLEGLCSSKNALDLAFIDILVNLGRKHQ